MSIIEEKYQITARAAIFDMDGVITDTMPYHFKAWEIAFQSVLGMAISEEDIYLREGSKGAFALEEIFEQYGWSHDPETLQRLLQRKEEVQCYSVAMDSSPFEVLLGDRTGYVETIDNDNIKSEQK